MHTITVDDSKRVRLPDVKPRQVFDYAANADGTILLTPVNKAEPKRPEFRFVKRSGRSVVESDTPIDMGALDRAIKELP